MEVGDFSVEGVGVGEEGLDGFQALGEVEETHTTTARRQTVAQE